MLGTEFAERRKKAGYSTRMYAACAIGVAKDTVKSWELGKRKVPKYAIKWLERIEALARKKGR
ncbi:MAG: hypothetical protein E6Q97_34260 [Desulfurellales bacterium]|nr:MAG: hypothetical protein E6Q97_34260 [Desulfurellales bacterium]